MLRAVRELIESGFRTEHGHEIFDVGSIRVRHPECVNEDGSLNWEKYDEIILQKYPIRVHFDKDVLSFKIMSKPVSEGGTGVQWSEIDEITLALLQILNKRFSSRENALAITKKEEALMWNAQRTRRRTRQGIEGKNEEMEETNESHAVEKSQGV